MIQVSIVTVCYNSEKHIAGTLKSVLGQTYPRIEHIIVDGGSSDRTLPIIKEYEACFQGRMKWVSEKDEGIFDALNKGIKMASGELIGLLHSDDWFAPDAVETVVNHYEEDVDIYHGNIYKVREAGGVYFAKAEIPGELSAITSGMDFNHTSCFVHRRWYSRKLYDPAYKIAADYKFILDAYLCGARFKYINHFFTYMRIHGASHTSGVLAPELDIYRAKKELLGQRHLFPFWKRIGAVAFYRYRKKLAKLVLPVKAVERYETRNWEKLSLKDHD